MDEVIRIDSSYNDEDGYLQYFCESSVNDKDPTAVNMAYHDWENKPETLMHQIYKQKVYDEGGYFCWLKDDKIIGGMGCYPFELDKNVLVFPTRLYMLHNAPLVRKARIMQKLVPVGSNLARDNYRAIVWFVNAYNEWKIKGVRGVTSETRKYKPVLGNNDTKVFDMKVIYKHTEQTALYVDFSNYEEELIKCLKSMA
jgi:hypothetical protein